MNKPLSSGGVKRWLLLLQEFNITVVDRPGKYNVVADYISRLNNPSEVVHVDDNFTDEHLFSMSTESPWLTDIDSYLVTGKTPPHYLIVKSGILYRKFMHILGFKETSFTLGQTSLSISV